MLSKILNEGVFTTKLFYKTFFDILNYFWDTSREKPLYSGFTF